jgi:hypothetical protein
MSASAGAKKAKRHQAVPGCWHSLATLGRWCRLSSYLDSAAAHGTAAHGTVALDAVRAAIEGKPGYRRCPPSAERQVSAPREWTRYSLLRDLLTAHSCCYFSAFVRGPPMGNIARFLAALGGICGLLLYVAVTLKNAGGSPTKRSAAAKVTRS